MSGKHFVSKKETLSTDGSCAFVTIKGQEIAVFKKDGEYYAVANWCPHEGGPLCEGNLKGKTNVREGGWELTYDDEVYIECPWHTWTFDIRTGEHVGDERYAVPTYDVVTDGDDIYVVK